MLKSISSDFLALLLMLFSTSAFAQSEKKTAYALLLDNTRSLAKHLPQVLMLGKGVVKHVHQRGPISLFDFMPKRVEGAFVIQNAEDISEGGNYDVAMAALEVEWSQDSEDLSDYIDAISVVKGHTALFESLHAIADTLNAKVKAEQDTFADKVIIMITDGEHRMLDTHGGTVAQEDERRAQQSRLIKKLKESGIRVYAVGLIRELRAYGGFGTRMTPKEQAESFLKKITKETGGRVVFPKSKNIDVDALLTELLAQ